MVRKQESERVDLYAKITDKIVAALEKGVRPWVQPWSTGHLKGRITRPLRCNGEPYSGINVLLLWSESISSGYQSPTWMTYRQATELGAQVRKGETGATVVYANRWRKSESNARGEEVERDIPFLKAYTVFNLEQIDELPDDFQAPTTEGSISSVQRIAGADAFFSATGSFVRHGGNQAFYAPASDHIQMPPIESFRDVEAYYGTLAHEHVHWVGAKHRIDRDLSKYSKDRSARSREELIAELGNCYLCADLGIVPELEPRPDHASYLDSWLSVLTEDKRAIFQAAAHCPEGCELSPRSSAGARSAGRLTATAWHRSDRAIKVYRLIKIR